MKLIYVIWMVLAAVFVALALGMGYLAERATRPDEAARDPMFRTPPRGRRPAFLGRGRPKA